MTHDEMRDAVNSWWDSLPDDEASEFEIARTEAEAFSKVSEFWFMKGWVAREH